MLSKIWKTHDLISWLNLENFNLAIWLDLLKLCWIWNKIKNTKIFQDFHSEVDYHVVGCKNMLVMADWIEGEIHVKPYH